MWRIYSVLFAFCFELRNFGIRYIRKMQEDISELYVVAKVMKSCYSIEIHFLEYFKIIVEMEISLKTIDHM